MFFEVATGGPVLRRVASPIAANKEANLAPGRHSSRRVASAANAVESGAAMSVGNTPLDPNRLTPQQAAKLLSAASKVRVPVEQIVADLEAGAPQNPDGTMNLMHYAAWLVGEMGRGD